MSDITRVPYNPKDLVLADEIAWLKTWDPEDPRGPVIRRYLDEIERLRAENARVHKAPCLRCPYEESWIRACRAAGVLAQVVRRLPDEDRDRVMRAAADEVSQ